MAKKFFESIWDKISGAEQWEKEQEELKRQRQQEEAAARREEQARQQRMAVQRQKDFVDEVYMHLYRIEQKIQAGYNDPSNDYSPVIALMNTARQNNWMQDYSYQLNSHRGRLRKKVMAGIQGTDGIAGLCDALSAISCLKHAEKINKATDAHEKAEKAADMLLQTVRTAFATGCYLQYGSYGECTLALNNSEQMNQIAAKAESILTQLEKHENILKSSNADNLYENITKYLTPKLIKAECMMMWFYANKWPFDVNSFEKARKLYLSHTAMFYGEKDPENENQYLCYGPLEEVLARTYAKNKIGGLGTAKQEKTYIDQWLKSKLEFGDHDPCYGLAHGLAWMELYEMEIEVLRQLIKAGADVPAELQDRLTFLENGGTADIKIYNIEPFDNIFFFDTSPLEWSSKDMSTFFRKVAMKKNHFQYSLALTKWTKTLPLASGQKISYDDLRKALKELVEDFDGEISCEVRNAATVNLGNAVFPDSTVFSFNSLRNRCVDVLFYCEKFGRNLNITIYTLFTPDAELGFEDMEQNCMAIKENMYVESFRESILQAVDETIKVRQTVYEDDDVPRKKMLFDD